MERGSILILGIIAVLILSIMAMAGLSVTNIEIRTSGNYHLRKMVFYKAVEVIEQIRTKIYENPEAPDVTSINYSKSATSTQPSNPSVYHAYITGTLEEFEADSSRYVDSFKGFSAPPMKGTSISNDKINVTPLIWYVPVTVKKKVSGAVAYIEVQSGIYSFLETEY